MPSVRQLAEGISERIQCRFPLFAQCACAFARRVHRTYSRIETLQRDLFVGEVLTCPNRTAKPGVRTLNRVDQADDLAGLRAVVQEQDEPLPRVRLQASGRRIHRFPMLEHFVACLLRLNGVTDVDRLDVKVDIHAGTGS